MYKEALLSQDLDTAARTVYGEARGESFAGKLAVAWVIRNRASRGGWWGDTMESVCKKKWQFSCWNENDPNREKLEALSIEDPTYQECLQAVALAIVGNDDPTKGANHYHTKAVKPGWSDTATDRVNIGNHIFLIGVK